MKCHYFLTGMHKPSYQTMCQICSSGFYQIRWGQENCDLCPENHYCPVSDYFLNQTHVQSLMLPQDWFLLLEHKEMQIIYCRVFKKRLLPCFSKKIIHSPYM